MKNEGLIHHRQTELINSKKSIGAGFIMLMLSLQVFSLGGFGLFFMFRRWGLTTVKPEWWEFNFCSGIIIFLLVWSRAVFLQRAD